VDGIPTLAKFVIS